VNSDKDKNLPRCRRLIAGKRRRDTLEEKLSMEELHKYHGSFYSLHTLYGPLSRKYGLDCYRSSAYKFRIVSTQFLGVPLYWINRDLFYAYMALTKQSFGIFVTTLTQWWAPTVVRISGDASVAGQLWRTADGLAECHFPERLVMIANHQVREILFI